MLGNHNRFLYFSQFCLGCEFGDRAPWCSAYVQQSSNCDEPGIAFYCCLTCSTRYKSNFFCFVTLKIIYQRIIHKFVLFMTINLNINYKRVEHNCTILSPPPAGKWCYKTAILQQLSIMLQFMRTISVCSSHSQNFFWGVTSLICLCEVCLIGIKNRKHFVIEHLIWYFGSICNKELIVSFRLHNFLGSFKA